MNLSNYKGVISDYSKSIEINDADAEGYLNRCLIYFEIGNDKFFNDFKKAASLGKNSQYHG